MLARDEEIMRVYCRIMTEFIAVLNPTFPAVGFSHILGVNLSGLLAFSAYLINRLLLVKFCERDTVPLLIKYADRYSLADPRIHPDPG